MDTQMFCFQCEQTAGSKGCMGKAGVCGKTSDVAGLQDQLTGALVGLARAADGAAQPIENVCKLMIKGLFTTITNVNFNEVTIQALIDDFGLTNVALVPNPDKPLDTYLREQMEGRSLWRWCLILSLLMLLAEILLVKIKVK